jgi:hypothetical protein
MRSVGTPLHDLHPISSTLQAVDQGSSGPIPTGTESLAEEVAIAKRGRSERVI